MSGKKKQRNAFYFYMLDMKEELRRQGKNVPMAQMSAIAGPKWSSLSDAEKAPYQLRAKHEKRNPTLSDPSKLPKGGGKMDSTGELLSEHRDLLAELEERRRRQAENLKMFFTSDKDAVKQTIFLLDIQPQCELKELVAERWLPCEMAVCVYSLAKGSSKVYHNFIHPGPIPVGYRYEAQSQSEQTHMLPVEGIPQSKKDYRLILMELQTFMETNNKGSVQPLLFAKKDLVEKVEFMLKWLARKAGVDLFIDQVYELELFLLHMDSLVAPSASSLFHVSQLLNTSSYDYEKGIRCTRHEEEENKFCSLSVIHIYSFVVSDHLCPKFSISVTSSHLPEQPDHPAGIVISDTPHIPRLHVPRGVAPQDISPVTLGRGRGRGLSGKSLPQVREPERFSSASK